MIKDFNIYEIFPTEDSYKTFLYNLKFKNLLICPYCYSNKISTYKNLFQKKQITLFYRFLHDGVL